MRFLNAWGVPLALWKWRPDKKPVTTPTQSALAPHIAGARRRKPSIRHSFWESRTF